MNAAKTVVHAFMRFSDSKQLISSIQCTNRGIDDLQPFCGCEAVCRQHMSARQRCVDGRWQ